MTAIEKAWCTAFNALKQHVEQVANQNELHDVLMAAVTMRVAAQPSVGTSEDVERGFNEVKTAAMGKMLEL